MLISVFSPKGGSGTSTNAVLLAKSFSAHFHSTPVILIDTFNGDLETIVGIQAESDYGFTQWIESPSPSIHNLERISQNVLENLSFVSFSSEKKDKFSAHLDVKESETDKFEKITSALTDSEDICIVDLGTNVNPLTTALIAASDFVIMSMKGCYLSLNRATSHPFIQYVDACIVLEEQGRTISTKQISEVLNLKCIIEIDARRDFARAIDAGVLLFRTPKNMIAAIDTFVSDFAEFAGRGARSVESIPSTRSKKKVQEYDRTQNMTRDNFDLFEDSEAKNKKDFWEDEKQSVSQLVEHDSQASHRTRRTTNQNPIDIAYTSHLHNAFAGMKSRTRGERS